MGSMGLIFTPVLVRRLLGPTDLSGPMTSTFWTHRCFKQFYILEDITRLQLPTCPLIGEINCRRRVPCDNSLVIITTDSN